MDYEVIVIGAGMVGTSIAWHLQKKKSHVLLIDKKRPGSETSYGNAGIIQREAIHVHPFPKQPLELLKLLPNNHTSIRYRWPAVLHYRKELLKYWQFSSHHAVQKIEKEWQTLIMHCTSEHQKMITAANIEPLIKRDGWLEIHRTEAKFNAAIARAKQSNDLGVEHKVLSLEALHILEPDCNFNGVVGAIHWLNSWRVSNPGALVNAYAESFQDIGGELSESGVHKIASKGDGWEVTTNSGIFYSQHLVVAAGPWSNELINSLGYDFPLFPMRGYHQHFKALKESGISHSMVDIDKGFVMGPMQQGIRITTGAEITLMDAEKNLGQLSDVLAFAQKVIPLSAKVDSEPWCGSRPCMPDMKPVIGAAHKHDNLWFAFGHGHQGFTLGPITGRIIEELIHQKTPLVDVAPFSSHRFGNH
ncbi:NAD(P)/FAD-dependent oxidoreductase [Marinomonas algicola]|uniref:NAD(P)/FAD-dependent oxidoreductase n=1 Tax=Marinomonas algicola TaxID=2773454 RepID=UPI001749E3EE|nr:FAD-dependent oxidoreductase [Marinomonas algicola]